MQLEQRVNVEGLWLVDQALDFNRPGTRIEVPGQFRRLVLVGAELVIVVVVGYILEWSFRVGGAIGTLAVVQLGARHHRFGRRQNGAQLVGDQRSSCQCTSAGYKIATI